VAALTDANAAVIEKYEYDVFGGTTIKDASDNVLTESAIGNPYGFTGRRLDTETDNYYYRMRYYNPDIGRFLQPDPPYAYSSMGLYHYCWNNPINWVDPYGLQGFVGLGGSGTAGTGGGGTLGAQFVFDLSGNTGIFIHGGGGGYGGIAASGTFDVSVFGGTIDYYSVSTFATIGAGGGPPGWTFGGEFHGGKSWGGTISTGPSASVAPGELHGFVEYGMVVPVSDVISPSIIADYWSNVFNDLWDSLFGDDDDDGYKKS